MCNKCDLSVHKQEMRLEVIEDQARAMFLVPSAPNTDATLLPTMVYECSAKDNYGIQEVCGCTRAPFVQIT